MVVCCTWAFWRGGPVERYGAAILIASWMLSYVVDTRGGQPNPIIITIDTLTMLVFIGVSFWSRRLWTLFAAAFMVDTVCAHVCAILFHFDAFSYITITGIFGGWGQIFALTGGVISYQHGQKAEAQT